MISPQTVLGTLVDTPSRRHSPRSPRRRGTLVLLLYFVACMLTIALPIFSIGGIPVRVFVVIIAIVVGLFAYSTLAYQAIRRHGSMLLLIASFGLLGAVVTILNGTDPLVLMRQVIEIHLQGIANLLLSGIVCYVCGTRRTLVAFLCAVAVTACVAVAQFIGFEAAWSLRGSIASLQHEVFARYGYFADRRSMGVSFSPITLATQLCLAFAAYGAWRRANQFSVMAHDYFDIRVILALALFALACVASGNRSPIAGGIIFVALYLMSRRPKLFWVSLPVLALVGALLIPTVTEFAQSSGYRVTETGDESAMGRITLSYYGLRLFLDNPFGYGLDFDPTRYWQSYWSDLAAMPSAGSVQIYPLHNYILSMLNFYGIGMLALIPLIVLAFRPYRGSFIFFVPYGFHILFHNAGPFWNDALIWLILPVAHQASQTQRALPFQTEPPSPRSRRLSSAADTLAER